MRIYLIGFMGSGKSYIGRHLAGLMGFDFVDMDDYIEEKEQKTISDIFRIDGEAAFRQKETFYLNEMNQSNVIISTGGGMPCFNDNVLLMKAKGLVVYLKPAEELLLERLSLAKNHRPLVADKSTEEIKNYITNSLAKRNVFYNEAHICLEFSKQEEHQIVDKSHQVLEALLKMKGEKYPIMEHFYTVQGEGAHQGKAAYFIRLGGCDVGCVWCDVKDSWDASLHPKMTVQRLLEAVQATPSKIVVVTGGEPLMHDLTALTTIFQANGYQMHIETSGAHPISGQWDWVTFSPKKFKFPVEGFSENADELKVVVFNKHDFKWAEEYQTLIHEKCAKYLQPEWDKEKEMLPLIVDYVKANPDWQISLQTHKYMDVP